MSDDKGMQAKVMELLDSGLNSAEAAEKLGIKTHEANQHIRKNARGPTRRHTGDTLPKVLSLFYKGLGPVAIGNRLGMTNVAVHYHLMREGIKVGRVRRTDVDMEEVRRLYWDEGWSVARVAEHYKYDTECLRRRMERNGIPRRSLKDSVPRGPDNIHYKDGKGQERSRNRDRRSPRRESWQVAAICLGHPLPRGWIVHHMDDNYENNDWENIYLFETRRNHALFHTRQSWLLRAGKTVDTIQLALENGAVGLPPPPAPIPSLEDTDRHVLWEKLLQKSERHKGCLPNHRTSPQQESQKS